MSIAKDDWLNSGDSKDYFELVRFPTVGADVNHLRDCVQAATWLKKWLERIGARAELIVPQVRGQRSEVRGSAEVPAFAMSVPVVFAEVKGQEGAPTVLLYGHYDVQPPDPLGEWLTPPFEPTVRDGRVYARGAQDDKGQMFAFLCGLREWLFESGQRSEEEGLRSEEEGLRSEVKGLRSEVKGQRSEEEGLRSEVKGQTEEEELLRLTSDLSPLTSSPSPLTSSPSPLTSYPLNLKIVLDGQEESGSGTLFRLLEDAAFRKRLSADVMLVCDTSAAAELRPAIVAGLRGVNHFTVTLTAANRDLHSGEYGGIAPNAALGMAQLLASLHNPDGSIAVAGFRDGIEPPSAEELRVAEESMRASAKAFAEKPDPVVAMYAEDIGTDPCGGQMGKTIVQRNAFEPTIEINGVHSGYGGPGSKTVIPCQAIAKISTRLVPGQSPKGTCEAIRRHLKDRCPAGMRVEFSELTGDAAGFRLPLASPLFRLAEDVLREMDERGAVFLWDGASIPVVSALRQASGAAPLMVGWGQAEDRIHSPNESFSIEQFEKAKTWAKLILGALQ